MQCRKYRITKIKRTRKVHAGVKKKFNWIKSEGKEKKRKRRSRQKNLLQQVETVKNWKSKQMSRLSRPVSMLT